MLMQNFRVTNKEHYGMLWYFLAWSMGVKFANPPLGLGLKYHDPPPLV